MTRLAQTAFVLDGELDAEDPPQVAETWVAGERVFAAGEARSQA